MSGVLNCKTKKDKIGDRENILKFSNKDVSGSSQTHGSAYTYVLYILISKKESGFLGLRVLESLKNYKITSEKMNDVPS